MYKKATLAIALFALFAALFPSAFAQTVVTGDVAGVVMDQTGAVLGPLMVAWIVSRTGHFGPAFLDLSIPAALALAAILLARYFRPNKGNPPAPKASKPLTHLF